MKGAIAAVLLLVGTLAAQQRTLVVDPAGGPFFDLPRAVAASRPGDRIEIHPGKYSETTVTHGLDLDAPHGATVSSLTVSGLAVNHAVRVDGITPSVRLTIDNCSGAVHVNRLHGRFTLRVQDSLDVAISHCVIVGRTPTLYVTWSAAGGGCLEVFRSTVVASRCSFTGGVGGPGVNGIYGWTPRRGGDGIYVSQAKVILVDCLAHGGPGEPLFNPFFTTQRSGDGGSGAVGWTFQHQPNEVVAVGGTSFVGGSGGIQGYPSWVDVMRYGPQVTGVGANTTLGIAEPPHLTSPEEVAQGATASVGVTTTPQSPVLLGIATWHDLREGVLPSSDLPLLLPASTTLFGFGVSDPTGVAGFQLGVPLAPWIANQYVVFQAVAGLGSPQLSGPGFTRIR